MIKYNMDKSKSIALISEGLLFTHQHIDVRKIEVATKAAK